MRPFCAVATRRVGAAGAAVTVTVALLFTDSTAAVTLPLAAVVPAVKVVPEPVVGDTDEPVTFVDHVAPATETGLPNASAPDAVNGCVAPAFTVALLGVTVIAASGAAATVSVCVALVTPDAVAVSVRLPAVV